MHIVLCDKDRDDSQKIEGLLTELAKKNKIPLEIRDFSSLESLLFNMEDMCAETDVLLMEVDHLDGDGIEAADRIRDMGYEGEIVFATNNRDQVFDAFDVTPFHYIIKEEAGRDRVEEILLKIHKRIGHRKREMISLSCAGERRNIPVEEIRFFEVDKRIIRVHYGDPDQYFEFYSTIGKLENLLRGQGILRVHRAYLLAMRHVDRATATDAFLDTGASIPLGRTYLKDFRKEMDKMAAPGEESAVYDENTAV